MTVLCVNVDHVATLREARKISEPDPVAAAVICETAGAKGITVHLREDRRHIQERDVQVLRDVVKTRLNLEMAPTRDMVRHAIEYRVDMATIVPEGREEITTEGGLDVVGQSEILREIIRSLQDEGIVVSLFVNPESDQIEESRNVGAEFIELHTGEYTNAPTEADPEEEMDRLVQSADLARSLGLRVNAGHGLNYRNVIPVAAIEGMEELNIGHAIIGHAVLVGLERATREMIALLREGTHRGILGN